ncbi:MAG: signal peptidase I [Defluviitaleaceae bacterium]|nr:signal peptidase I [Defluviitaleaceae bacterium]
MKNSFWRGVADWLVSLGLAVLLFFVIRNFVFRTAHVDGNSMTPTLEHGDMVVLNRFVYLISSPGAGDIVAFPFNENPSEHYIKRVVAVPGDTVDLVDGFFWINDELLDDEFSAAPTIVLGDVSFPITIEDNHFFVLGDNRNGSQDSRASSVGTIYARDMVGRASLRIWPISRVGRVN